MKWDWSKILIAVMAGFIIMIVGFAIRMATSEQSIYEEDYYELGESHAERMEKESYASFVAFEIAPSRSSIEVSFDSSGAVSTMKMVHLANAKLDRKFEIKEQTEVPSQLFTMEPLAQGSWVIEIDGVVNGNAFFLKKRFTL